MVSRTSTVSPPHVVTIILILHVGFFLLKGAAGKRSSCLCKTRYIDEEFETSRKIPPIAQKTCLKCKTLVAPESLEWIFIPSSLQNPANQSIPKNACVNRKTRSLTLKDFTVSRYMNAGTYNCVNKDNNSAVLCSFKVKVKDHYRPRKTCVEGNLESIEMFYTFDVSNYRWYYRKPHSSTGFMPLIPDEDGTVNNPCRMNVDRNEVTFNPFVLGCAGLYQAVAYSSFANFSVSQIMNVSFEHAEKTLSLRCPFQSPIPARLHGTVTCNCTGTLSKRLTPSLTFLCQGANGKTRLNDTITVRVSSPNGTIGQFHFGHSKLQSKLDQDLSLYLEIANISTADDGLTCSIIFQDKSTGSRFNKTFTIKLDHQLSRQQLWRPIVIAVATCIILVLVFSITFFQFELEIAFLCRRFRARIVPSNGNAVGVNDRQRPWLVVLHGPSTAEAAARVCQALKTQLPQVACHDLSIGEPGTDRGDVIHQCLAAANVAVTLMTSADFGHRPAVLEKALEQCLSQLHTTCLYVVMETRIRLPQQLRQENAVLAKRLKADLHFFGGRRRRLRCSGETVDDATVSELIMRLRLLLPLWSLEPIPDARSFELY